MSVRVQRPGLLSTLQDLGRHGLQHLGIVPCGAMDPISHSIANALVGNPPDCATLECTLIGPELVFEEDALLALYGASFEAPGGHAALPANRPVLLSAGTVLAIGSARRGSRGYLAIAGGFSVHPVLGSRSTYLPGQFGGVEGRALKAGDRLETADGLAELSRERFRRTHGTARMRSPGVRTVAWLAPELTIPAGVLTVRAMPGRHHAQFDKVSRQALFGEAWRISATSNRMGYRLEGRRLRRSRAVELLSEPTCLGTVQVPNDGTPIVLMADHQTTGGYPKIAEVAGADMPCLAQLAPGARFRFAECTVEEAQEAEDALLERARTVQSAVQQRLER